jgi:riboflavin biosynthesis pyrimidine reductase
VYEGLSRVDADAVMAGSATARGRDIVFSVWHPELVALRRALGRPRHPAQIVVTDRGDLRFDDGLMFQEPDLPIYVITRSSDLPIYVITRSSAAGALRARVAERPWVHIVDAGEPVSFTRAFRHLRQQGIQVVSCVGGRRTATALLLERLVSDIYLTTSAIDAGEPGTPYYEGPRLPLTRLILKEGRAAEEGVRFEHLLVNNDGRPA